MLRFLIVAASLLWIAACASSPEPVPEPTPPPVAETAPPPPPPPAPVRDLEPIEPPPPLLPDTASSRPALALAGLIGLAGAGALRWLRARIV